ncbi:MAG TPA: TlyA family RNA methyltransferase [Anaerolineae bacterium]|nr:TlyA family RNA methyltransferase [Anaerolineae bacterium]HIQ05367.1 TlyA family RNA methyltransferase [Anaerolineae bacterium]
MVEKRRLDLLLVERGLAESRTQAQRLIMAGQVLVDKQVADKPGHTVPTTVDIHIRQQLPYVSRGGLKLAAALDAFGVQVKGTVCADIGASTGGFTDCLLQRGATRVYAVDVGYGQLAWKLRQNPQVVLLERTNARYLTRLPNGSRVDLITVDVSFISLKLVLPAVVRFLAPGGQIIALIKPQFEAGREAVGKGGVVRDPMVHRAVLTNILEWALQQQLGPVGLIRSPITGPAGNVEFLLHLKPGTGVTPDGLADLVNDALDAMLP